MLNLQYALLYSLFDQMDAKECVSKKRPTKQYLSNETLTGILDSRYQHNLTDKECSMKHNVSITLTKKIIKKYGDEYVRVNRLNAELPEVDALVAYWGDK